MNEVVDQQNNQTIDIFVACKIRPYRQRAGFTLSVI